MGVPHNLIRFELECEPEVPDAGCHVGLDEHVLGLEVAVGDGGLYGGVPAGRNLCMEVGEAGGNAEADATQLVQAEGVQLEVVAEGAPLVEGGHQPELHLEVFATPVHPCHIGKRFKCHRV